MRNKIATVLLLIIAGSAHAQVCGKTGVWVQVLGSGGPELQDKRASSSYLVWRDGAPRVLVDAGGGSALRFGESGANVADLDMILFTHFHIDHSADFPAIIKSSFFENRERPLPIYGPGGNDYLPSATQFIKRLFDPKQGLYPYLSDFIDGNGAYQLQAHDVSSQGNHITNVFHDKQMRLQAISVTHGDLPALAWLVDTGGKRIAFSGDMNGNSGHLEILARHADLLIAHNAIPEGLEGVARNLHMPPSVIGQIAGTAQVKQLVLSHRMLRTLGHEKDTLAQIRKHYSGPVHFADDLDCFQP